MNKRNILVLCAVFLLVVACGNVPQAPASDEAPQESQRDPVEPEAEVPEPVEETELVVEEPVEREPTEELETSVKQFTMVARNWEFDPATITVNKGDTVQLTVTSEDITHGFSLPQFGVSETLTPGKTIDVEFTADKSGTFSFFCSVPCGSGHGGMRGKLIVE